VAKILFLNDPLDPSRWEQVETDRPDKAIRERFTAAHRPDGVRIYDMRDIGDPARASLQALQGGLAERDITPRKGSRRDLARLGQHPGPLLVTVSPADPVTVIIASVVAVALSVVATFLLMPKMGGNQTLESPNNSLSDRSNKARVMGRITDILGAVRCTLDLLAVPYTTFVNHQEVEIALMCVGRGAYEVDDVRDGDTLVSSIAGAAVSFYDPGTWPGNGVPFMEIGSPITDPVLSVIRMNDVNGQVLRAPNSNVLKGDDNIRFVYPDQIQRTGGVDFTDYFDADDELTVTGAVITGVTPAPTVLTASARFTSAGVIQFQSVNPSASFAAGNTITLQNGGYAGENVEQRVLIFNPAAFPASHDVDLDKILWIRLFGANPAKFYHVRQLYYLDIGTRFGFIITQSDDASGTGAVDVCQLIIGSGASFTGPSELQLVTMGGSGITATVMLDFGGGVTSFAAYNGTYATAGFLGGVQEDGPILYVDLAGEYVITSVDSTSITLTSPATVNPQWTDVGKYASDRTEYATRTLTRVNTAGSLTLNGTYTVLSVTSSAITLSNPALVNPDWNSVDDLPGGATPFTDAVLSTSGERWVGPFVIDLPDLTQVISNFQALQGLYRIDKKSKQRRTDVQVLLELTPVDSVDMPSGPPETFTISVEGSADTKTMRAATLYAVPSFTGRCQVRARRVTATDNDYEGTIVDEVKWITAYGTAEVPDADFGNVTIAHARTYATSGATSVKSRKLNCHATRRIPLRETGTDFTDTLHATERADEIIAAVCFDPYIGRRDFAEVDVDSIYDSIAAVEAYFGSEEAVRFGYSFDDSRLSAEEIITTIAQAVFCTAYRVGNILRIKPELANPPAALLFNHRNILPGTQRRAVTFGVTEDSDGVEGRYAAESDGAPVNLVVPPNHEALAPRSLELTGIRYDSQAFWHVWRAWNKLLYQNVTMEFSALQVARLVIRNDLIMVSNQTQPGMLEGHVVTQDDDDPAVLEISQPVDLSDPDGWTMFLQHTNGSVEAIPVAQAVDVDDNPLPYWVALESAPAFPLVTDPAAAIRTVWIIVANTDARSRAYLVATRDRDTPFTEKVKAINYSPLYYLHDTMVLWLSPSVAGIADAGPWNYGLTLDGGAVVDDVTRAHDVYEGAGGGTGVDVADIAMLPTSYTVGAWLKADDGQLFGSATEALALTADTVTLTHDSTSLAANWPGDAEWTHLAVSYDAATDAAVIYVNGQLAASGDLEARDPAVLRLLDGTTGRADDLRIWRRALSAQEIRALYRSTR
jgi:hypothetical protein